MNFPSKEVEQAYEHAKRVLSHSYSPYSHFRIAACVKVKEKNLYVEGVNVENASYGGTICAERTAIVSLIAQGGVQEIDFLLTCASPSTIPCSLCRQVLGEFCSAAMPIYITSPEKDLEYVLTLGELLPHSFNKAEYERVTSSKSVSWK